jgi:hypothetical protein
VVEIVDSEKAFNIKKLRCSKEDVGVSNDGNGVKGKRRSGSWGGL